MINYLEHHIVNHCNLNCAGCSHFSPLAKQWFETKQQFEKDFTQLQKISPDVKEIRIMGGEPLLHPDVLFFCTKARELFPDTFISLVTNGILWNKRRNELKETLKENKIFICTSNYGLNIDLHQIQQDSWFSRVDQKNYLYNISLQKNPTDLVLNFNHCDLHQNHWFYFQDGYFYPCCIGANFNYFKEYFNSSIPFDIDNIRISIYEHNETEILNFLNSPKQLCAYCNTIHRSRSYHPFYQSKKEIEEWICQ